MKWMPLSAEVAAAERRVIERRREARLLGISLALHTRRRMASPMALLSAAGAGWVLGSRSGRHSLVKIFSALQLALAALSAVRA
jgi:hypothetical protein